MSRKALRSASRFAKDGDYARACEILSQAEQRSRDPRLTLQRANILLGANLPHEARELLEGFVNEYPASAVGHLFLGIALFDCGEFTLAEREFGATQEIDPSNELVRGYRALAQVASGGFEEGYASLSRMGFPSNTGFRIRLTQWMEEQWIESGRFFSPRSVLEHLRSSASETSCRWRTRTKARKLFARRQYEEFLRSMVPLLETKRIQPSDLYACAIALELLCDYRAALELLDRLDSQDRELDPVRAARARCLIRFGQYESAIPLIEKILVIGPEDFGINYYLGLLSLAQEDVSRAREFFRRSYEDYLVDTLDFQFWQIQHALAVDSELRKTSSPAPAVTDGLSN